MLCSCQQCGAGCCCIPFVGICILHIDQFRSLTLGHNTAILILTPAAEASCVSQILTAEAVASDIGVEAAASIGIQEWANSTAKNSERSAQAIMAKQRTKLDIPVKEIVCDGTSIPWISPESWLPFLVKNGLWPILCGASLHDYDGARSNLTQFWKNFQKIHPTFELFNTDYDLTRTVPCLLHGDEGRTLKKGGILITSLQSALGAGYNEKRVPKRRPSQQPNLQVNYGGHTFTTRYVVSCIPKTAYDEQPELYHEAMTHVAVSCRKLLDNGFADSQRGGEILRMCVIGIKGDAPFLAKAGRFYRGYNTSAKRGEERGPPKGLCPFCLAGTVLCEAEEIATSTPKWLTTVGVKMPWVRTPGLVSHLLHDPADPSNLFKSDIWHVVHLGFGRSWIASTIQLILPQLPCANLDDKWAYLTDHYHTWCAQNRQQKHVKRITAYLMSYNDSTGTMGCWSKGALTSTLLHWLVDLLGDVEKDGEGLLVRCRETSYRLNSMFSLLYRAGAFLSQSECKFVSDQGLKFLESYYCLACIMYAKGCHWRYPLYPKLHIFQHIMLGVKTSGELTGTSENPIMYACQMDEDTVGKASRLSRRVSIKQVAKRSLDRYLVAAQAAMVKEKLLA